MKVNKKRLLNVAKALRESPAPEKFTMDAYGLTCGSPACAFGHYSARRDLQKSFRLQELQEGELFLNVLSNDGSIIWHNADKVLDHFGIEPDQARELFDGDVGCGGATTVKQAARYIERFVARNSK